LKWSDIDQCKNLARISRAKVMGKEKSPKTKAGKRTIKLLSQAMEAIKSQEDFTKSQSEYVFHDPRKNEPWKNDQAIRKVFWYPALEKAGIAKRCIYETRHTFASLAISAGENILWVSQQMGHDQVSTTLRTYARYIDEADSLSGQKLEKLFCS
ncbi:MAG: site-specific integrase, partial [Kangiellaceae bacterium]|nr:site-specific integrase [Kangiellaceae bacterium]